MPTRVYLDYHATTPVDPRVLEAMLPYFGARFGNASSRSHVFGWEAEKAVDLARKQVAELAGASPREIVFTSGATESDNLAIKGAVEANRPRGAHVVTVATEHKAVLDTVKRLEKAGVEATVLPVGRDGLLELDLLRQALRPDTVLASVMYANNEIGVIQPVAEIGAICRERGVLFHSDAVQSTGALPFDVRKMPVDLVSLNAHKFYRPKGVGALYVRKGTRIATVQTGGGQEKGRRTGTENVAGIVGLGVAMRIASERREVESARQAKLRDRIIDGVLAQVPDAVLTGHRTERLPNNASFCFRGADGPSLVTALDLEGFAVSSGSACTSGTTEPSHVLLALGLDEETAKG
jgi:cysteine desulfurase